MQKAKEILRRNNLRDTPCRRKVLDILSAKSNCKETTCAEHCTLLSADEILHKAIKDDSKNVPDRVTVYRVLKDFLNKGIVSSYSMDGKSSKYEFSDKHHHHVVCTSCGILEKIHSDTLEKAFGKLTENLKHFKNPISHSVEFSGICNKCR